MLMREFHDKIWWPRCQSKLREITLESYQCAWKNWIEPTFADCEMSEIDARSLDKWIDENHVTPNAWRVCKALIRCAYRYEVIESDPCSRVLSLPAKRTPKHDTLTREEMVKLMDGLKGTVYYPAVVCSCTMGLRREESCGLMWEDFDWNKKTVRIERGVQFVNGREIYVEPKTPLSLRTLPLPDETIERLRPLRSEGRITGDLHVHQIATGLRSIAKKRSLPYVPMSNLRTSWCTLTINSGMPVSKVSRYMGHGDVETTMRWYTKAREDELVEVTKIWGAKSEPESKRNMSPSPRRTKAARIPQAASSHCCCPKPRIAPKENLITRILNISYS